MSAQLTDAELAELAGAPLRDAYAVLDWIRQHPAARQTPVDLLLVLQRFEHCIREQSRARIEDLAQRLVDDKGWEPKPHDAARGAEMGPKHGS